MPTKPRPLDERFWGNVVRSDVGCWGWTGAVAPFGYGRIGVGGRKGREIRAHRLSWEIHFGKIPADLVVCHHCDNPPCTRPDHLFLGTHADNIADMVAKGRHRLQVCPGLVIGEKNPAAKITDVQRDEIRQIYGGGGWSQERLAQRFGLTQVRISQIVRGIKRPGPWYVDSPPPTPPRPVGEAHPMARLSQADVATIRERLRVGHQMAAIARDYGVWPNTIMGIKTGRTWATAS